MDVHEEVDFGRLHNLDIEQYERALIAEAMRRCSDNMREACKLLGISRFALARRLDKFGMKPEKAPAAAAPAVSQAQPEMMMSGLPSEPGPANDAAGEESAA